MQELIHIATRTIIFYFFIVFLYRIMGKREIAQLGVIDLIISILMAELAAISIEDSSKSIWLTIIPLSLLGIVEISLAYLSIKSRKFRSFVSGKTSLIICKGKLNYQEMVKQRYSMDDLLINLRGQNIKNILEVEYAFLEPNGNLSVFKYDSKNESEYPMPLILDGEINNKTLEVIGKNVSWLNNELQQKQLNIKSIFYAFYKQKKIYIITKEEI